MTLIIAITAVIISAALAFVAISHRRQLQSIQACRAAWQRVDLQELASFFDSREQELNSRNLPFLLRQQTRLKRTLAAWESISRLAANAKLMLKMGQIAYRRDPGDQYAAQIMCEAMHLRIAALKLRASLLAYLIQPNFAHNPDQIWRTYDRLAIESHLIS